MLADVAMNDAETFAELVNVARNAINGNVAPKAAKKSRKKLK